MGKTCKRAMAEASKMCAQLATEMNPQEYQYSSKGYTDLTERLEHIKNLVIAAQIFEHDLN